jgi:hypothetical protein
MLFFVITKEVMNNPSHCEILARKSLRNTQTLTTYLASDEAKFSLS